MRLKGLFNIFLVLVLVSVGFWFVTGNSFTTPDGDSQYIFGNTTFTITFNSSWKNVTRVTIYNITSFGSYTALNMTHNMTFVNGLPTNLTDYNRTVTFTINTHNFTQGNYTFIALVVNSSASGVISPFDNFSTLESLGVNATYINISAIIDNVPPSRMQLIAPLNQTFVDNTTIQFGINVSDSMSGNYSYGNLINCTLNIQGNGSVLNYMNNSVVVVNNTYFQNTTHWFNVSATSFDSGYHVWNISCVDYNNNVNSSVSVLGQNSVRYGGNFTLTDNLGPTTGVPTLSVSSVATSGSVVVTCVGTDSITSNPTEYVSIKSPTESWPAQQDIGISPYTYTGTNTVGTYTTRCRSKDTAGNFGGYSSEVTFAVTKSAGSSQTSGGSSGSGGSTPTLTVNAFSGQTRELGNFDNGQGIINAYQSSVITFSVGTSMEGASIQHSIKFDSVDYINGEVTVTLSSDPVTLTMKVGDVENVDLDGDGVEDVEVTLNSIDENGKVNMNIKDLTVTQTSGEEGTTPSGEQQPTTTTSGMSWIWWVIIVIVVVVIIALVLPKKKR